MDDAEGTWIIGITKDMGTYATLNYLGGTIRIYKAMRSAQACKTNTKTGQTGLQEYVGFSGTVRGQRSASRFVHQMCVSTAQNWSGARWRRCKP